MNDFHAAWVYPFYLKLLRGNYAFRKSDLQFIAETKAVLGKISPAVIDALFAEMDWRCRITAAWFCGLKQWQQYDETIGLSLLESRVVYAGQGYCFALAHFANEKSIFYLIHYLEKYLPQVGKYYDQGWAMGALIWIDKKQGTNFSSQFLASGGLWETFAAEKVKISDAWAIEVVADRFNKVMKYSIETFGKNKGVDDAE